MAAQNKKYRLVIQSELDRLSGQENEMSYQIAYLIYQHQIELNQMYQQHSDIQLQRQLLIEQLHDES